MPCILKRLTGLKFHAEELPEARKAINVFTEIWVPPFNGEICPHLRVKSPPFYKLLLTRASRYVGPSKNLLQKRNPFMVTENYDDTSTRRC